MKQALIVITVLLVFGASGVFGETAPLVEKPAAAVDTALSGDSVVKTADSAVEDSTGAEHAIIVYYFYGNRRCVSCKKIEAYTEEAVTTGFAAEIESGLIEFRPINTDDEGNEHFMKDYQLYTKSVVLSEMDHGEELRWTNLEKVWKLLSSKEKFIAYVQGEIGSYLEKQ